MTDYEQFLIDTWAFVRKAVPDASEEKQMQAVAEIAKKFRFLFDKKGKRRQFSGIAPR